MQIKTITYSRQKSSGNYNSQTLEITVAVGDDEDENAILDALITKVNYELGITSDDLREEIQKLERKKDQLSREIESLQHFLQLAKERWEKAQLFMEKHGIPLSMDDSIPF